MKKTEEDPALKFAATVIVYIAVAMGFIAGLLVGGAQ